MHIPKRIAELSLQSVGHQRGPFPPTGFCEFAEHALGNGDAFGLYWPFGREAEEPIVCETWHDEGALKPLFSSLDSFLTAMSRLDPDECPDEQVIDSTSPAALFHLAETANANGRLEEAHAILTRATRVLPEYTDAQALLATVNRRLGRMEEAVQAALQALISPPCFGSRPISLLRWLQTRSELPEELSRNPIWVARHRLHLVFGGTKHNDDYLVMREAIDAYVADRQHLRAVTLMQTYAELMFRETISFQERYGFDWQAFRQQQHRVFVIGLSTTRELAF
jgi:tetratricopeptide (TPR) repeat protein